MGKGEEREWKGKGEEDEKEENGRDEFVARRRRTKDKGINDRKIRKKEGKKS